MFTGRPSKKPPKKFNPPLQKLDEGMACPQKERAALLLPNPTAAFGCLLAEVIIQKTQHRFVDIKLQGHGRIFEAA